MCIVEVNDLEQTKKIAIVAFAIVMVVLGVAVVYAVNASNYRYGAQPYGNSATYGGYGPYGNYPANSYPGYYQGGNTGQNGYGSPYGGFGGGMMGRGMMGGW